MTHKNQGKRRWYETLADSLNAPQVAAPKPPTLEGWSFSVYNGAEEHASGWGSASLADMAPALLAAVGMTDAATAHKRAQVAETRVIDLAHERDGAVEALDAAYATLGKLHTLLFGEGVEGDLPTGVQQVIESRRKVIAARDSVTRELAEVVDALVPRTRHSDTPVALAKRTRANLDRWEAFTHENVEPHSMLERASNVADIFDRHFDLRLALTDEIKGLREQVTILTKECDDARSQSDLVRVRKDRDRFERELTTAQVELRDISSLLGPNRGESVTDQARRARAILDRWQDIAVKQLPACPQVSFTLAIADLGSRHFALRGYMEGEVSALRSRLSLAAEREDLTLAALGHPCSTNGIPEAVRLLRRDAERWLTECGEVGARAAAYSAESVRLSTQRDDACAAAKQWEAEARKAWAYGNQIDRVLPAGGPNDGLLERAVTLAGEATRLRGLLDARSTSDALTLTKPLRAALGWSARTDLNPERVVEAAAVAVVHASTLSKEVTRLNAALENTGGYGAREAAKALRKENESLRNQVATLTAAVDGDIARSARVLAVVRTALETPEGMGLADHAAEVIWRAKALDTWQTWARSKISDLHKEVALWKAESAKTFAQLQEAYDAVNSTAVLSDECRAAVDYLIAYPGRGLTAELAHEGAKALRQRLENGLPLTQPLRYIIDMALTEGVNAAHNMWDAEVQRTRDDATVLRKRLNHWVAWGCRAACVISADDNTLRSEIDKALPMWRRGTPEV